MATIHLVRHGQASFGAADYDELSDLGRRQSALLGQWIRHCKLPLNGVALGSQKRHRQSAEASLGVSGVPIVDWRVDAGFNEFDHHEIIERSCPQFADPVAFKALLAASGNPRRAFQQIFAAAVERWSSGDHHADYRESWPQFRARCQQALQTLINGADAAARDCWVFTSGGPITAIVQGLLQIPDRHAFELNAALVNTGVTTLRYRPGQISVSTINSHGHLENSGQPELITYR